jgi:16S rRNA (guanine527-N7)-methyltransferase
MAEPTKSAELASPIRGPADFAAAFNVSRETLDRLATYEQLLRQWQKTINLVAPSTLDAIWHRHFADLGSSSPGPQGRDLIDLGPAPAFRAWWWPYLAGEWGQTLCARPRLGR